MARTLCAVLLAALTACSGLPQGQVSASACAEEASYACQIERYQNASQ